jgi:DNA-binding MarR family transcriptional regulator
MVDSEQHSRDRQVVHLTEPAIAGIVSGLHDRFPGLEEETVRTGIAIVDFANRCLDAIDRHFRRYELSPIRFSTLMILYHQDDETWTPARLADALGVSRPTLTGILRVLERDGWIRRRPDPDDRRRVRIRLSGAGRRRFPRTMDDHFRRVVAAFEPVEAHDYEVFREEMTKMLAAFEDLAKVGVRKRKRVSASHG